MTKRYGAMVALLVAGCGGPVPVRLTTWDQFGPVTEPSDEARELLDDAFGFWGLSYELSDGRSYGRLNIDLVDVGDESVVHGRRWDAGPCEQYVWAARRSVMLAHEMGHVFGLERHSDDPDNIMATPAASDVTDHQLETVQDDAHQFTGCIP